MPHITLEYSENLEALLDVQGLCVALKDAAVATGIFPPAGIRVRAIRAEHVVIADGDARHGFVDVMVRLGAGRSDADKTQALDALFDAACGFTAAHMAAHPFMLSMELVEIDAALSRKTSSIRQYLPPEMH
ncbi:MAG: 5-carboxymethyl-2-hydroxymuconate isomerase [Pseudomonadota bacterium]